MRINFHLLFYMKKQNIKKSGSGPIFLRITVQGQRAELSTGRVCSEKHWNTKTGRHTGKSEQAKSFNTYLDQLQGRMYEAHRRLLDQQAEVTAQTLRDEFLGREKPKPETHTLLEAIAEHNDKMQALVGKQYAIGTLNRFKALDAHVRAFLITKKLKDIDIRQVDQRLISNFEFYLRSSQDCANNTTVKYLKNLGKIIRICLMNQWIDRDPMLGYKLRSENVERPFLTADELERIHQIQFDTPRLGQVRDVFLFCCYTGLSYADVVTLSPKNIQPGVDGHEWIFANRTKTGTRSAIPLLPKAKLLLEKYQEDPYCQSRDRLLPVTSNQKLNEYLKEIAERCHINKVLTMHIARHTFATTVTLQNGIPIETVSKMLGHTSLRTTQIYAKVLDSKIGKDMEKLRGKF